MGDINGKQNLQRVLKGGDVVRVERHAGDGFCFNHQRPSTGGDGESKGGIDVFGQKGFKRCEDIVDRKGSVWETCARS
jgi:hypothetical protein